MKIQEIKSNQQSKYEEIIEYLKQDNGYWLKNDKWDFTKDFFIGKVIKGYKYMNFSNIKSNHLKNEIKFFFVYKFKEKLLTNKGILRLNAPLQHFCKFYNGNSILELERDKIFQRWKLFLINRNIKFDINEKSYFWFSNYLIDFINDFYDDREETEKDIWYSKNIKGAKIPASGASHGNYNAINFSYIPMYYRETVKKYFRTIITKKSWMTCYNTAKYLSYFFNYFYSSDYSDGFVENLNRNDMEKYLYHIGNDRKGKNRTENSKYVSFIRTFLEYIQIAQYDKAPKKEVSFLIFQDDIPRRETNADEVKKAKFVPEPILKQLDNNIMDLDRPQFIPIYILLRETGWRGTDILNLKYHDCLEQIWNSKEKIYNYYLCGEITKTGIAQLKIPIRDKIAEMVQKSIDKAKELSNEENNPNKYLFNTYEGKLKGKPLAKATLLETIKRLIEQKDIRDINGELYHFKLHSLRHTRAKEYVEQGMGISIIQQILGHQSLQMTVHYATVTENVLYEKWKNTEDLELFKVDTKTNDLEKVDLSSDTGENLIRYEYVKKNLDAVRVPFGVCFKSEKFICKQQMNHCLNCGSFCTTTENIPEYEEEIEHVKKQIDISERCGRELWAEKNKIYLRLLEDTLKRVREQKIIHKNGKSREEV
ncbi:tyrosine-type recombinase/integrase [Clostridium beijerinckii]|uniref:tyrosine-type recombinase/integrase n=1 Tax=Clostridium beijerinckii TaxID=1520 RepID=UPI0012B163B6|nr:tyrosine-type recombinase/integrase [Clostridium beijerinckii]MRY42698.1 tyrosine-type recombinase/integrase [Parabacteroides distasonis]MZK54034.1 tyrosine-type recombinase/integrase [Clostridium beijerinckii]MZK61731.1 tyrosine-type recombinase/integrase [Clostridium beijerinckii]MZK71455.1 tyrosine-type recombinase/integrase [Clostridium beijerinckii]MZK75340.1 tyrosine-type recombinase/integrase [Clostridium beijerinckii]